VLKEAEKEARRLTRGGRKLEWKLLSPKEELLSWRSDLFSFRSPPVGIKILNVRRVSPLPYATMAHGSPREAPSAYPGHVGLTSIVQALVRITSMQELKVTRRGEVDEMKLGPNGKIVELDQKRKVTEVRYHGFCSRG
jgi:hypothetical protein